MEQEILVLNKLDHLRVKFIYYLFRTYIYILETNHLPSVTIISASGNSVESQKKSFSEKHLISAYLQKPFTKEVLLSKLLLQSWAQSS